MRHHYRFCALTKQKVGEIFVSLAVFRVKVRIRLHLGVSVWVNSRRLSYQYSALSVWSYMCSWRDLFRQPCSGHRLKKKKALCLRRREHIDPCMFNTFPYSQSHTGVRDETSCDMKKETKESRKMSLCLNS